MWKDITVDGCTYEVVIADDGSEYAGQIIRAVKTDHNGGRVPASVYRADRRGGWTNDCPLTEAAFRAGIRRGTLRVM